MLGGGCPGPRSCCSTKNGWLNLIFYTDIYYCEGVDLSEATVQIELLRPLKCTIYCCKKLRPQFEL